MRGNLLWKWTTSIATAVAGLFIYLYVTHPRVVMEEIRTKAEQMRALFEATKADNDEHWRRNLRIGLVGMQDPDVKRVFEEELSRLDQFPRLKEDHALLQSQYQTLSTEKQSLDSAVLSQRKRVGELEDTLEREIPVIAWTYPQEPNTVVCEGQLTICWRITNKAENQGFLVTLADGSEEHYTFDPEISLGLRHLKAGNCRIAVLPLSRHGMEYCGNPITCSVDYRPPSNIVIHAEAQPPLIKVIAVDKERDGEPADIYRMTLNGKWAPVPNGRFIAVPGLCAGRRTIRLKAVNSKGIAAFQDFLFTVEDSPPRSIDPKNIVRMQSGQSLADVIATAKPGSRVLIPPGIHEGGFNIDKVLELVGDGPREKITISHYDPGIGRQSCIHIDVREKGVLLKGLTVVYETPAVTGYGHLPPRSFASAIEVEGYGAVIEDCAIYSTGNQYALRSDSYYYLALRRTLVQGGETSLFCKGSHGESRSVVEDSLILKSGAGSQSCELDETTSMDFKRCCFVGPIAPKKQYAYRLYDCDFDVQPSEN